MDMSNVCCHRLTSRCCNRCYWLILDTCGYRQALCPPHLATPQLLPKAVPDCHVLCQAAGYCCNDPTTGANEFVSCAQACMMRRAGLSETELLTTVCEQRNCFTTVLGTEYPHCSECTDLTSHPKCENGVPSTEACKFGATYGLEVLSSSATGRIVLWGEGGCFGLARMTGVDEEEFGHMMG